MGEVINKIPLAMVSYTNSKPFLWGLNIKGNNNFDIIECSPAECATLFLSKKVDVALVPIGALNDFKHLEYEILSNYCISCDGAVETVCLFSNDKLSECNTLILDSESRTSVLLSLILLDKLNINIENIRFEKVDGIRINNSEVVLMIGDKAFTNENNFKFKNDLGAMWKELFDLPFTFAVWVTHSHVDAKTKELLSNCLKFGTENLDLFFKESEIENPKYMHYLKNVISYNLNPTKLEATKLFMSLSEKHFYINSDIEPTLA